MRYIRTYDGAPVSSDPQLLALLGAGEPAVPVLHTPKGKRSHLAGLGVILEQHDNEGWDPQLAMEIAPAAEYPGSVEQPAMPGRAWNLICGECGHRLSKRESELLEKTVRAIVHRRAGSARKQHTVQVA